MASLCVGRPAGSSQTLSVSRPNHIVVADSSRSAHAVPRTTNDTNQPNDNNNNKNNSNNRDTMKSALSFAVVLSAVLVVAVRATPLPAKNLTPPPPPPGKPTKEQLQQYRGTSRKRN